MASAIAPTNDPVQTRSSSESSSMPVRPASATASIRTVPDICSVMRARSAGTSRTSRIRWWASAGSRPGSWRIDCAMTSSMALRSAVTGGSSAGRARSASCISGSYSSVRTMSSFVGK
jgi:hypothetical protein